MISCLELRALPDLECLPAPIPHDRFLTLTEVATAAIYGAPLSPDEFKRQRQQAVSEACDVWCHPNGASDMLGHLQAILAKVPAPAGADNASAREQRQNVRFWVTKGRKGSRGRVLSERAQKHKAALAELSDREAIKYAIHEADRENKRELDLAELARRFYQALNVTTISGEVVLKGVPQYLCQDVRRERPKLSGRRSLCDDDLCSHLLHSLDENEFDIDPAWAVDDPLGGVFDRDADLKLIWKDLRLSPAHAESLLSRLANPSPSILPAEADRAAKPSRRPGPDDDADYIREFAQIAFPNGERPKGMSKTEYRNRIAAAMEQAKSKGQNRRVPHVKTFGRHGF